MLKTIIISDEIFQGFSLNISLHNFESIKDLCEYIKDKLISNLILLNLDKLIEKAKLLNLHSHEYKFYQDICSSQAEIIYLCCHSHI
jgi:hypothetical protein